VTEAGSDRRIQRLKGSPRRILVVDDHWENRNFLRHLLEPIGFEIEEATTGVDCLDRVQLFQPDAVLMDLLMPEMDGFETSHRLRQTPGLDNLVIIATSASAFEQDRQRSFAVGCTDFLPKPIQISVLLSQLQQHLHLNWLYTDEILTSNTSTSPPTMAIPPPFLLESLVPLTRIGDIQGILHQAAQLESENPDWKSFADEIRQLAKTFQIKKLQAFVEESCQEGDRPPGDQVASNSSQEIN
jgi:CheY-like chemotaxis protein